MIGRDCDQCRPEHYGLSLDDEQGCKPCECDIGGSWDNNCDIITGQCKCRPNIEGRRYTEKSAFIFMMSLDCFDGCEFSYRKTLTSGVTISLTGTTLVRSTS